MILAHISSWHVPLPLPQHTRTHIDTCYILDSTSSHPLLLLLSSFPFSLSATNTLHFAEGVVPNDTQSNLPRSIADEPHSLLGCKHSNTVHGRHNISNTYAFGTMEKKRWKSWRSLWGDKKERRRCEIQRRHRKLYILGGQIWCDTADCHHLVAFWAFGYGTKGRIDW